MQQLISIEVKNLDPIEFITASKQVPDIQIQFAGYSEQGNTLMNIQADDPHKFFLLGLAVQPLLKRTFLTVTIPQLKHDPPEHSPEPTFKLFDSVIVSGSATGYGDISGYVAEIDWDDTAQEYFFLITGSGVQGGGRRFYVQEKFLTRQ